MPLQFSQTMQLFFAHNFPLILFSIFSIISLILAIKNNSRFYILLFVAFFVLAFKFEYSKHLLFKIENDMINSIFTEGARGRKYDFIKTVLEFYLPVIMNFFGWGLLVLNLIFGRKKRDQQN